MSLDGTREYGLTLSYPLSLGGWVAVISVIPLNPAMYAHKWHGYERQAQLQKSALVHESVVDSPWFVVGFGQQDEKT